ncbi:MAG TPA: hypothetical protein VFM37_17595 [Pseudonocardiaceae bacterium]|nr:hypothetical protein [Pseudonocardiaceae bacterium]
MSYSDVDPVDGHLQPPEVRSGGLEEMIADQSIQVQAVDWIFERITGRSLIETVITPITGDWTRIAANGDAWRSVGAAVDAISNNLTANVEILRQHWTGGAADSFANHVNTVWAGALSAESALARLVGDGFEVVAEVSQQLCQEALDLLQRLVDKLLEAIAMLPIPFVGWARAIKIVWDAYQIYQSIMGIIETIRGVIEAAQQLLDAVGRIRGALEMIPDVRDVGDALDLARQLTGGVDDAVAAADSVQDQVDAAGNGFNQATGSTTSAGTVSGGSSGSW